MKVLISDIPDEGLEIDGCEKVETDTFQAPVILKLKIEKVGSEVIIRGNIIASVNLICSRCLKEFINELSVPIDVIYHPVEELNKEDKHEIAFEELDLDFYTGDELDLKILIQEQIMLNLPMKPLCLISCKGICPKCGKDLNEGECECKRIEMDSRFQVLKKLL